MLVNRKWKIEKRKGEVIRILLKFGVFNFIQKE